MSCGRGRGSLGRLAWGGADGGVVAMKAGSPLVGRSLAPIGSVAVLARIDAQPPRGRAGVPAQQHAAAATARVAVGVVAAAIADLDAPGRDLVSRVAGSAAQREVLEARMTDLGLRAAGARSGAGQAEGEHGD